MGEPAYQLGTGISRQSKLTVNVEVVLGPDLGSLVNGHTTSVEHSTQHVFRNGELHGGSRKGDSGSQRVDTCSTFKDLQSALLQMSNVPGRQPSFR
jgi:hypothetical protein